MSITEKHIIKGKGAQKMLRFVILSRMVCVQRLCFTPEVCQETTGGPEQRSDVV